MFRGPSCYDDARYAADCWSGRGVRSGWICDDGEGCGEADGGDAERLETVGPVVVARLEVELVDEKEMEADDSAGGDGGAARSA